MNEPPENPLLNPPSEEQGVVTDADSTVATENEETLKPTASVEPATRENTPRHDIDSGSSNDPLLEQKGPSTDRSPDGDSNDVPPPLENATPYACNPYEQVHASGVLNPHPALAMQFYEARMRDHAVAYASAAAGAAWAAAQVAQAAADYAVGTGPPPPTFGGLPTWNNSTYAYSNANQFLPSFGTPSSPMHPHFAMYANSYYFPEQLTHQYYQPPVSNERQNYGGTQKQDRNGPGQVDDGKTKESIDHLDCPKQHHQRRKRQQRLPLEETSIPKVISSRQSTASQGTVGEGYEPYSANNNQSSSRGRCRYTGRGKVRRRLLRSDGDSSSSGSNVFPQPRTHNKKKARSDESLLGKTAISALYEWCSKRQRTPSFLLQKAGYSGNFAFKVVLEDGEEYGVGDGCTKIAAKQLAAKRSLQALVPGVVFDESTGVVVGLRCTPKRKDSASLEADDLAPNLAKRLAIGHNDEDCDTESFDGDRSKLSKPAKQAKRTLDIYPGTSTASEDEDENEYYTSRGASVCSALLHALVQIDPCLPEPPSFTYGQEESILPTLVASLKGRKNGFRVHRPSYKCTAALSRIIPETGTNTPYDSEEDEKAFLTHVKDRETSSDTLPLEEHLEASGIGGTKREARHIASSKLLALLFPECESMVEVKAAAEAIRDAHVASKGSKAHPRPIVKDEEVKSVHRCMVKIAGNPPLPEQLRANLELLLIGAADRFDSRLLDRKVKVAAEDDDCEHVNLRNPDELAYCRDHVDRLVEIALQNYNDHDEEGRCLPDELTADDVGRTILRKATDVDLPNIVRLFELNAEAFGNIQQVHNSETASAPDEPVACEKLASHDPLAAPLKSTTSIVLLLCRAITPFNDPPLGCAILTRGFSTQEGCNWRVTAIANEPHVPPERFIECIETFAKHMDCVLEPFLCKSQTDAFKSKSTTQASALHSLASHFGSSRVEHEDDDNRDRPPSSLQQLSSHLQSVAEESELSESSTVKIETRAAKRMRKPNKKSRVN